MVIGATASAPAEIATALKAIDGERASGPGWTQIVHSGLVEPLTLN
jgi:hypothetical protein